MSWFENQQWILLSSSHFTLHLLTVVTHGFTPQQLMSNWCVAALLSDWITTTKAVVMFVTLIGMWWGLFRTTLFTKACIDRKLIYIIKRLTKLKSIYSPIVFRLLIWDQVGSRLQRLIWNFLNRRLGKVHSIHLHMNCFFVSFFHSLNSWSLVRVELYVLF